MFANELCWITFVNYVSSSKFFQTFYRNSDWTLFCVDGGCQEGIAIFEFISINTMNVMIAPVKQQLSSIIYVLAGGDDEMMSVVNKSPARTG